MTKIKLEKGTIISEMSYFKVDSFRPDGMVILTNDKGVKVGLSQDYIDSVELYSADQFETEEFLTATDLADLFIANPYVAMTVAYMPQGKDKTKKQLEADKAAWADEVSKAFLAKGIDAIKEYASKPVETKEKTAMRVLRGRHFGSPDAFGRVSAIDMDIDRKEGEYDNRARLVDTRTIQYFITKGVKYSLKKK